MIPCKIFLQNIDSKPQRSSKYKIAIILNNIYFDEIRIFQTKYLCLSAHDRLEIQAQLLDNYQLVSKAPIPNAYKSFIDHETIQIFMKSSKNIPQLQEIKLTFILQPVSIFIKQKLGFTTNQFMSSNFHQTNKQNVMQKQLMDMSFSKQQCQKQISSLTDKMNILDYYQTAEDKKQEQPPSQQGTQQITLEYLASEREKILGQLFQKFRRK